MNVNETENLEIAVLVACHNRKAKTLRFLEGLVKQVLLQKASIDIYLLDDGSTDGTQDAVKKRYPFITILTGSGNLFWAGGMRKIWEYAMSCKRYDIFLLYNDDVVVFDQALERLIMQYKEAGKDGTILIGSTLDPKTNKISYGGYLLNKPRHSRYAMVTPHEVKLISCHIGNGNVLLIDAIAVDKIGIFSDAYTHYLADFDYTLTASASGINVLLAPGYYGYCEFDHGNSWMPGSKPLKERINYLYSPTGLAYKEYLFYIRKHFKADYYSALVKLWLKTLFPFLWDIFKKEDHV